MLCTREPRVDHTRALNHQVTAYQQYVERANLTMRMHMRRFTRLTNAFSKKFENHCHMIALYAVWYNFIRIHKTLRVAPAMESGIVDRLFSFEDLVGIVDEWETREKLDEVLASTFGDPSHTCLEQNYAYPSAEAVIDPATTEYTRIDALGSLSDRVHRALFGLSFKLRHYPESWTNGKPTKRQSKLLEISPTLFFGLVRAASDQTTP